MYDFFDLHVGSDTLRVVNLVGRLLETGIGKPPL